jgi:hypothetical protein
VAELEALETVATFSLLSDDIKDGVNELGSLSVVTLSPVVTSTSLTEDEVVRTEELTEGAGTDGVHGTWLQVNQDCSGDIAATSSLVEVDVDTFELKIAITVVGTGGVDTMFISNYLPELGTDLVTTLTRLNVY